MNGSKKLLRTVFFFALVLALSALFAVTAGAVSSGGGTVNASSLNFRSEPSTASSCLGYAFKDDPVIITGTEGDWYSVIFNGVKGYMFATYVTPDSSLELPATPGTVNANSVRLRDGAGYDTNTLTYLNNGAEVTVTGVDDCWYQITSGDYSGYIFSGYVTLSSPLADAEDPVAAEAEKIVAFAKEYLGISYVYGGASPSGFDCSGFTSYVLKNNGYDSTRTATSQYYQYTHISKSDLKVGDLVFFASYKSWDTNHVGIYIGDGEFIHASSGAGKVVISCLDDWYYDNFYYGAARYLPY